MQGEGGLLDLRHRSRLKLEREARARFVRLSPSLPPVS